MKKKNAHIKVKFALIIGIIFLCSAAFFGVLVSAKNGRTEAPLYKYYTSIQIQKGDTLWDIAEKYCPDSGQMKSYVKELKAMNRLNSDEIHAGNYLTVAYYSDEYK